MTAERDETERCLCGWPLPAGFNVDFEMRGATLDKLTVASLLANSVYVVRVLCPRCGTSYSTRGDLGGDARDLTARPTLAPKDRPS